MAEREITIENKYRKDSYDFKSWFKTYDKTNQNYIEKHNLWNEKHDILIKDFYSVFVNGQQNIHIVFKHYKGRRIDKVTVVLFADHGMKNIISKLPSNLDQLKEYDPHYYNSAYREGVFYLLDIPVNNPKEDVSCSWLNIPLDESGPLAFSTLCYHDKGFVSSEFSLSVGRFEEVSKERVVELETPKPNKRISNKTDQASTSEQEQTIFYNVKKFFADAENRALIENSLGERVEADVFIPSINVAIEYDGKAWHKNKVEHDNFKNEFLNNLDIYVIRVRDRGLPKLKPFNGMLFYHGKAPAGKHMNEIVTDIVHSLCVFIPQEKRADLQSFELTYDGFLEQRPNIEALLFKNYKENNFTKHPCFKYWDYKKNGDLNPENLNYFSNAFAWFICPKGDSIIRIIEHLTTVDEICLPTKSLKEYCIFSICPFLPMDKHLAHGRDCGQRCPYVETLFIKMMDDYIENGVNKAKLDTFTLQALRYYPRAAYMIVAKMAHASGENLDSLKKVFFSAPNIYNGNVNFLIRFIKLDNVDELPVLLEFNRKYPKAFVAFNWDIFDADQESREALKNYLEELLTLNPYTSLDPYIRDCRHKAGTELRAMINDLAAKNHKKLSPYIFENEMYTGMF